MEILQPSEAILSWAKGQPNWRQDSLRRLLTKPFAKADEDECLEILKAAHGVVTSTLTVDPLDNNNARTASSMRSRSMSMIDDLRGNSDRRT
jgi:hypothetical protein